MDQENWRIFLEIFGELTVYLQTCEHRDERIHEFIWIIFSNHYLDVALHLCVWLISTKSEYPVYEILQSSDNQAVDTKVATRFISPSIVRVKELISAKWF